MAKSYHAEVKWRDERYVPTNVEEHLEISIRSSACMQIANMAFILLGDVTTSEAVEWAFTFPKIIVGVCIVGRIGNDIVSHKVPDNVSPIHTKKPVPHANYLFQQKANYMISTANFNYSYS